MLFWNIHTSIYVFWFSAHKKKSWFSETKTFKKLSVKTIKWVESRFIDTLFIRKNHMTKKNWNNSFEFSVIAFRTTKICKFVSISNLLFFKLFQIGKMRENVAVELQQLIRFLNKLFVQKKLCTILHNFN